MRSDAVDRLHEPVSPYKWPKPHQGAGLSTVYGMISTIVEMISGISHPSRARFMPIGIGPKIVVQIGSLLLMCLLLSASAFAQPASPTHRSPVLPHSANDCRGRGGASLLACVRALAFRGDPRQSVARLLAFAASRRDPVLRMQAIGALARRADVPEAAAALRELAASRSTPEAELASIALSVLEGRSCSEAQGDRPASEGGSALQEVCEGMPLVARAELVSSQPQTDLERTRSREVRDNAASFIARADLDVAGARLALLSMFGRREYSEMSILGPWLSVSETYADALLAVAKDPRGRVVLEQALTSEDPRARQNALFRLCEGAGVDFAPAWVALDDDNRYVRWAAALCLSRVATSPSQKSRRSVYARSELDRRVRDALLAESPATLEPAEPSRVLTFRVRAEALLARVDLSTGASLVVPVETGSIVRVALAPNTSVVEVSPWSE